MLAAGRTAIAVALLSTAALTDMLDGWVARREGPRRPGEHHRGDWLDPVCDKLFAAAVVIGLLRSTAPPLVLLVLLLAREILQVIAVAVLRLVPALHRVSRDYDFRAHALSKVATAVQFLAAGGLVLEMSIAPALCVLCAALGVASVGVYIYRIRGLLPSHAGRRA